MKKLKYLFLLFLGAALVISCSDDEESLADQIAGTPNVAAFVNASFNMSGVADGRTVDYEIPLNLVGPDPSSATADITVTIEVDAASTAVEGTHFSIESKQFTLTAAKGYRDKLPVTMLTDGVVTPLEANPVLILKITDASSSEKVVASAKPITVSMLFLCPSELAGDYSLSVDYFRAASGGFQSTTTRTDSWTQTGDGQYRTTFVGHWSVADLGGEPGFDLIDVCNVITIPEQNLVNLYSNLVEGVPGASSVDAVTGDIHLEYTICASDCREYFADYVKL